MIAFYCNCNCRSLIAWAVVAFATSSTAATTKKNNLSLKLLIIAADQLLA